VSECPGVSLPGSRDCCQRPALSRRPSAAETGSLWRRSRQRFARKYRISSFTCPLRPHTTRTARYPKPARFGTMRANARREFCAQEERYALAPSAIGRAAGKKVHPAVSGPRILGSVFLHEETDKEQRRSLLNCYTAKPELCGPRMLDNRSQAVVRFRKRRTSVERRLGAPIGHFACRPTNFRSWPTRRSVAINDSLRS
jgi:hypothetical protein